MKPVQTLAAALCLLMPVSAHAALPPEWQRMAEFEKILASSAMVDNFPHRTPVDSIERIARDLYRVTAGPCSMDVRIVDKPVREDVAGPRQFEAVAGKASCNEDTPEAAQAD